MRKTRKLVIFGISNFAEIMEFYFSTDSDYEVVAFTVDEEFKDRDRFLGRPVVSFKDLAQEFPPSEVEVFVAMGIQKLNTQRENKVREVKQSGYQLASFLHSSVVVPDDFVIGENSVVMDQCLLHPFVTIGNNTILWTHTAVAMKTQIGNNVWMVSCTTGEMVTIDDNTFIGLRAIIAPGISIGKKNLIGAGVVLLQDTGDGDVVRAPAPKILKGASHRFGHV